jgi:hypothetical protein
VIEGGRVVHSLYFAVLELTRVNFEVVFVSSVVAVFLVTLVYVVLLFRALHHGLDLLGQFVRQNFAALF